MLQLAEEIGALGKGLATAQSLSVEDGIRLALEEKSRIAGVVPEFLRPHRCMSVEAMLAVGAEIAAMPFLDARSPREIMDDLGAL